MSALPNIQTMGDQHLAAVSAIELSVSPHPWTYNQFRQSLVKQHCLVLLIKNQVCGFLIYSLVAGESELFIIAVARTHQGNGYGKKLLEYYFAQINGYATKSLLEVRRDNEVAIALYTQAGYTVSGIRKNYYKIAGQPIDALLMSLNLESTEVESQ